MALQFEEAFIYPKLDAESYEDAVRKMSQNLLKEGYVTSEYPDQVLAREKNFPTGLVLANMNIGIPHTEAEYVKKTAVAVATLREPVKVHSMIDPEQELPVSMMFMIAVSDPKGQVTILRELMRLFQDQDLMEKIMSEDTASGIYKLLKSNTVKEQSSKS